MRRSRRIISSAFHVPTPTRAGYKIKVSVAHLGILRSFLTIEISGPRILSPGPFIIHLMQNRSRRRGLGSRYEAAAEPVAIRPAEKKPLTGT